MQPKMEDLSLLEKESIYIPLSYIQSDKRTGQDPKVFAAYCARMYRKYGIWIQSFADIALNKNDKPVYFHESNFLVYFKNQAYKVDVVNGNYLVDYFSSIRKDSYVIISVKDEGSQQISKDIAEQLQMFGITKIDNTKLRHSYLWIACKKEDNTYDVLFEECSIDELRWEGILGETKAVVSSGGALATNNSCIQINDVDRSLNQRGFNIVTLSPDLQVESTAFDTFVTLYAQGSLFRANPPKPRANMFRTICHAGGRLDGVNYTNCKEAFEQSYTQRGHRVFEADIEITSDGELVLRHDWDSYFYQYLQQHQPYGSQDGESLSLKQFTDLKILNKYTPLTITEMFQFLADHPDAQLITDTKYSDPKKVEQQFNRLVEAAEPFGYSVLFRVIPQLYTEDMYDVIEKIFPFPRYVYTLYQMRATDSEVIQFVKNKKISFVTIYSERYSKDFGMQLKKLGASVFIHTINDLEIVREYISNNVDGFYTDDLSTFEVDKEFLSYQVELDTRRNLLSDFLTIHFQIPEDEARKELSSASLSELVVLGEPLFQSKTVEEAYAVLNR